MSSLVLKLSGRNPVSSMKPMLEIVKETSTFSHVVEGAFAENMEVASWIAGRLEGRTLTDRISDL